MGRIPLLEIAIVFALAAHLLATNVASAAPLASVWLQRRGLRDGDAIADNVGLKLARWAVGLFVLGMLLGAALLGLLWLQGDQQYFSALRRIPQRRYAYIGIELVFSLVLMVVYAGVWKWGRRRPNWHALLALLAASNTLYHFPPLMVVLARLSEQVDSTVAVLDRETLRHFLMDPQVMARVAHIWIASFAVTGVAVMWLALRSVVARDQEPAACRIAIGGSRLALGATLLQAPLGLWVLLTLPDEARSGLLGDDLLGTGLFLASVLVSLALMHVLAGVALGEVTRKAIGRSVLYMAVVVLLMSGTLRRTRVGDAPRRATVTGQAKGVLTAPHAAPSSKPGLTNNAS